MIRVIRKIYSFSCCCIWKERKKKNPKTAIKVDKQPSSDYSNHHTRLNHTYILLRINVESCRVQINNSMYCEI